jgi:hypothetical protein
MKNHHIMGLALALCNAGTSSEERKPLRVPAMKGSQLKALLDYIRALKA